MKLSKVFLSLLAALVLFGCSIFNRVTDTNSVAPSGNIITETRQVSGFDAIELHALGKITLRQGDVESLTITGSDNIVALVTTTVRGGALVIDLPGNTTIRSLNQETLTYEIVVKDLNRLAVSGLGAVEADALAVEALAVKMSGAGSVTIQDLQANRLDIELSGLGEVTVAGKVTQQSIRVSGAGSVLNGDLQSETASIEVPGLGSSTIWVTGQLTGRISGSGSVSYYGSPATDTEVSGIGNFNSLGDK